jgi:hypothetical protein
MLTEINNLREIARRCLANEPLDESLSNWLGASLSAFLCHNCQSIDDALGLRSPQGGVPWWMEEAIRERDSALRQLAEDFYDEMSVSAQSRRVRQRAVRYAASAWRYDRERMELPEVYRGTEKELLWRAFKSGAAMPISDRQLRNILAR